MPWGTIPVLDNAMGGSLYTASGSAASAKAQYKNQLKLQKDAQEFSKWQMANAHQQEVADLEKAGLNPVLSAGGSGASAGVSMGSASAGSPVIDPINAVGQVIGMVNTTKQTNSQVKQMAAQAKQFESEAEKSKAEKEFYQAQLNYYREHGVFPGAVTTRTSSGGNIIFNGSSSETIPVGLRTGNDTTNNAPNSAKKQRKEREKNDALIEKHEKQKEKQGGWWY